MGTLFHSDMAARCSATLLAATLLAVTLADIPVHCRHDQIVGSWVLHIAASASGRLKSTQCATLPATKLNDFSTGPEFGFAGEPNFEASKTIRVTLKSPNLIEAEDGSKGTWSMVYDQGFLMDLGGRRYFAFSKYQVDKALVGSEDPDVLSQTSLCHETFPGWHFEVAKNDLAAPCSTGCFYATKATEELTQINTQVIKAPAVHALYLPEEQMVESINQQPGRSWRAATYEMFKGKTMNELLQMGGGSPLRAPRHAAAAPKPASATQLLETADESTLPDSLDWTDKDGASFVATPSNQGSCGSCYAVSSADALSSRLKISKAAGAPDNLSSQQMLCSDRYAQGCSGGFPVLIWLFAQAEYLVSDSVSPYKGNSGLATCSAADDGASADTKVGASKGGYIGGYYGACSERAMIKELQNGPIVVAFEATGDFFHYKEGVYEGTPTDVITANRWEPTNHAVVAVGYGTDAASGLKYWKVKNSWGPSWGEAGFFRIARGTDVNAIESMASAAHPVVLSKAQQQAQQQCSSSPSQLVESDEWQEQSPVSTH